MDRPSGERSVGCARRGDVDGPRYTCGVVRRHSGRCGLRCSAGKAPGAMAAGGGLVSEVYLGR
jgi:hypothetical protein